MSNGFFSPPITDYSVGSAGGNSCYLSKIVVPVNVSISAIILSLWSYGGATGNVTGVIYDSNHSVLIASTTTVASLTSLYNRFAFSSPVALTAGTYYVGYVNDPNLTVYVDSSSSAGLSWWVSSGQNGASPANPLVGGSSANPVLMIALEANGSQLYGFNPNDKSSSVTLNGIKNISTISSGASIAGARSSVVHVNTLPANWNGYYAEVTVTGTLDNTNTIIGVSNAFGRVDPFEAAYMGVFLSPNGSITGISGGGVSMTYASGDTVGIALAFATSNTAYVFFRVNGGSWYNVAGADATNGNIYGKEVYLGAAGFPFMIYAGSNTACSFRLRERTSDLLYSIPYNAAQGSTVYYPWSSAGADSTSSAILCGL